MAISPIVEQNLIVTRLATGFTVHEDDQTSVTYTNGVASEYVTVDFGSPVATAQDRSIGVEELQPYVIRVIVGYVAGSRSAARTGASAVVANLLGFVPSSNCGPLKVIGGGSYTLQEDQAKPAKYIAETYFTFVDNLAAI